MTGRSFVDIADGVIIALRDEYIDEEMERFGAWLLVWERGSADLTSGPTGQCSPGNYPIHRCYDPLTPVHEPLPRVGCSSRRKPMNSL